MSQSNTSNYRNGYIEKQSNPNMETLMFTFPEIENQALNLNWFNKKRCRRCTYIYNSWSERL
jgi:hypothetical protein